MTIHCFTELHFNVDASGCTGKGLVEEIAEMVLKQAIQTKLIFLCSMLWM